MKKQLIILLGTIGMAYAEGKTITGPGNFSNETSDVSLKVMGPITATKLTAQDIDGYGPGTFTESTVNGQLTVRGPLTANKSTFKGLVDVTGAVTATDSVFENTLTITGGGIDIDLTNTKTKDITVNIAGSGVTKQVPGIISLFLSTGESKETRILLKGTTEVGSIRFTGGEGTIVKDESAKITGQVSGAKEAKNESTK